MTSQRAQWAVAESLTDLLVEAGRVEAGSRRDLINVLASPSGNCRRDQRTAEQKGKCEDKEDLDVANGIIDQSKSFYW